MLDKPNIIQGGQFSDVRGLLFFYNDFDMTQVQRFYRIFHKDTTVKRGWRGHKVEQRWFTVTRGSFSIKLVKIDDWENPTPTLEKLEFLMSDTDIEILNIPAGYASCIQATVPNSEICIFADAPINSAGADDHLYPLNHFGS